MKGLALREWLMTVESVMELKINNRKTEKSVEWEVDKKMLDIKSEQK